MSPLMIVLLVLFFLALGGGGLGHSRFGVMGWTPAGLLLLVLVVVFVTGGFR